jgi:hypothetical protein
MELCAACEDVREFTDACDSIVKKCKVIASILEQPQSQTKEKIIEKFEQLRFMTLLADSLAKTIGKKINTIQNLE